jgi:hypothetical protein
MVTVEQSNQLPQCAAYFLFSGDLTLAVSEYLVILIRQLQITPDAHERAVVAG